MPDGSFTWVDNLLERLPALRKLGQRLGGKDLPFVAAMSVAECGAACLAMVLGYHGKSVSLDDLRSVLDTVRGTDASELLGAARKFGLLGEAVRVDIDDLGYLAPASILHWEFNHFVVFQRADPRAVYIVDPAIGLRRVPLEEFRKSFTGVALQFEKANDFVPSGRRSGHLAHYLKEVLFDQALWSRLLVTSIVLQVLNLAIPLFTGALVQTLIPRGDEMLLLIVTVGLVLTVALFFFSALVRAHLLLHLKTRFDARLMPTIVDHAVNLPFTFYQSRPPAEVVFQLQSAAQIRNGVTTVVLTTAIDGLFALLYLAALFLLSVPMAVLTLAIAGLHSVLLLLGLHRQRYLAHEELESEMKTSRVVTEIVSGIETIKAQGAELNVVRGWVGRFVSFENAALARGQLEAMLETLGNTFRLAAPLFILVLGTQQVMKGQLELGTMLALNAMAFGFILPFSNLVSTASTLQKLVPYMDRLDDLLNAAPEQDLSKVRTPAKLRGHIELRDVSFRYSPNGPWSVRNVSFVVEPGQFIAIVGPSGCGKSTLAKILGGLYAPQEGQVLYDGDDLSELDLRMVRQQIGFVPQRPNFFTESIYRNICNHEPGIPNERVEEAAKLACIHDDILAMPMGYETLLVNDASIISGGQRQRIALARALVRKPQVLLLDEATSALDTLSEAAIQRSLAGLHCTRVIIAHRMSTIQEADRILVVQDGQLIDQGTHRQLAGRCGLYQELLGARQAQAAAR